MAELLLAHFGKEGKSEVAIPTISQETLGQQENQEAIGQSDSRRSRFFRNEVLIVENDVEK